MARRRPPFEPGKAGAALLLQSWGADFVKHAISKRARYNRKLLFANEAEAEQWSVSQ